MGPSLHSAEIRVRFERFVQRTEDGCALWTGHILHNGYGQFGVSRTNNVKAHLWAYEEYVGPMPEGMESEHECSNKHCVNVGQYGGKPCVVPATHGENMRRRVLRVTHCKYGHPKLPSNTYVTKAGYRCAQCARETALRWYHEKGRILRSIRNS